MDETPTVIPGSNKSDDEARPRLYEHKDDFDYLDLLEDDSESDEEIQHNRKIRPNQPCKPTRPKPRSSSPTKILIARVSSAWSSRDGADAIDSRPIVNKMSTLKTTGSGKDGSSSDQLSSSSSNNVDGKRKPEKNIFVPELDVASTSSNVRRYENKPQSDFITGFNVMSKEARTKRNNRAKRFGIVKKEEDEGFVKEEDQRALKKEAGVLIPKKGSKIDGHLVRPEALFLCGVDNMSTQDVFRYFGSYGPSSIEWLNDTSCNVVWLDSNTTTRALMGMSQSHYINKGPVIEEITPRIDLKSHENTTGAEPMEEGDDDFLDVISDSETGERVRVARKPCQELVDRSNTENRPITDDADMEIELEKPFDLTEEEALYDALPFPKSEHLQIRYATKFDRKQSGAQNRSWYYIRNGNPNYNGMKGVISNSMKKRITEAKTTPSRSSRKRRMNEYVEEEKGMKREKTTPHGDGDAENLEQEVKLLTRAPSPKRVMRMYADDVEQQVKNIRKLSAPVGLQVIIEPDHHHTVTNRVTTELNSGIIRRIGRHPLRSTVEGLKRAESQNLFPDLRGKLTNRKTNKRLLSEHSNISIADDVY